MRSTKTQEPHPTNFRETKKTSKERHELAQMDGFEKFRYDINFQEWKGPKIVEFPIQNVSPNTTNCFEITKQKRIVSRHHKLKNIFQRRLTANPDTSCFTLF